MADGGKRTIALVLSGGVGLGAFQAGAYARLHEAGIVPDWIAASSIGAVNGALIAGGPPENAVDRLRRFWNGLGTIGPMAPAAAGPWRHAFNWTSVLRARLLGQPGLFAPRLARPGTAAAAPSLYDLAPLRQRLEGLVDFDRLNAGPTRLSVATTDVLTGELCVFQTAETRIGPAHILASCGYLPEFPPIEIEGRVLGDGGLVANCPIGVVLGEDSPRDLLCIAVDLFAMEGGRPRSLEAGLARRSELTFASQTRHALEGFRREYALGRALARAGSADPQGPELDRFRRAVEVVHLAYRAPGHEAGPEKQFDFSPATLEDRWRAGAASAGKGLEALAGAGAGEPGGFRLHHV